MPQIQLPFFPHGATEINVNLTILREGDTVTYMYNSCDATQQRTRILEEQGKKGITLIRR